MKYTKKRLNKKRVLNKKSKRRPKTKKNTKKRRYKRKYVKKGGATYSYKPEVVQSGGFVGPLLPEFSNLAKQIPYGLSTMYNGLNPPPVSAPANPMKHSINPHPTKDQYLRGKSQSLDKNEILGPKLPEIFDTHINANPPLK